MAVIHKFLPLLLNTLSISDTEYLQIIQRSFHLLEWSIYDEYVVKELAMEELSLC